MTSPEKCPKCGAFIRDVFNGWARLDCESIWYRPDDEFKGYINHSKECKDRQIADLTKRLEVWRALHKAQKLTSAVPFYRVVFREGPLINKLRKLGEIE